MIRIGNEVGKETCKAASKALARIIRASQEKDVAIAAINALVAITQQAAARNINFNDCQFFTGDADVGEDDDEDEGKEKYHA